MDWEPWEDGWRDVKCRFKGRWSSLDHALEGGGAVSDRRPRAQLAARRRAEEDIEWQELEAGVLASDLEELILDFAAAGSHH